MPSTLPAGTTKSPAERKLKPRTTNVLGLNPSAQEPDSASDDEDEEAKLASTISTTPQAGLTYEYLGRTATLRTAAEIAAWVTERRKRYPTAARVEQAKKETEEKRKKWEEEKKANTEVRRLQREVYEKEEEKGKRQVEDGLGKGEGTESEVAEKARLKTAKLLKKAAKAQKQLEKAQNALKKAQDAASTAPGGGEPSTESDEHFADTTDRKVPHDNAQPRAIEDSDASSVLTDVESDDEDTSSSGSSSEDSSESESESAPEVLTTKRTAPDRVLAPPRTRPNQTANPAFANLCRNMLKTGQCKHGKKCLYSHELPDGHQVAKKERKEVSAVTGRPKRKRLWEIMVEKEEEEERRQLLKVIVELGNEGLLE